MRTGTIHFWGWAGALLTGAGHAAGDVPVAPPSQATLAPVEVRAQGGLLHDGAGAQRRSLQLSETLSADDLGALHTPSVAEALQRMTGVQLSRDRGEAGTVSLRGLSQLETTLNGREVFTAGGGRTLDFSDLPADLLRSLSLHKTATADQLGGGLAGVVDLQTWRPLDRVQPPSRLTLRGVASDPAGGTRAQTSVQWSQRWRTGPESEWGALLNLSVQDKAWREDQVSVGAPAGLRSDLVPGQAVYAPHGTTVSRSAGLRQRTGEHVALQWRPAAPWELYAEATRTRFSTRQNTHQFTSTLGGQARPVPGSLSLFPGTADVQSVAWAAAPFATQGFARDTVDRTAQHALGGSWTGDDLTLSADLSRTRSHNDLDFTSLALNGQAPALGQDLAGRTPAFALLGTDPGRLDSYASTGLVRAIRPFQGHLSALRLDGELALHHDGVPSLRFGARWARRWASNMPGQRVLASPGVVASLATDLVQAAPDSGLLTADPELTRDPGRLYAALGLPAAVPASNLPGAWTVGEHTRAAYVMARLQHVPSRWTGSVGLRLVHTLSWVQGYQSTPTAETPQAVETRRSSVDVLPSLQLRHEWAPGLYLRAAASKTVTRPDFSQVAPSLTLHPVLLTGTAGNPALGPMRARNLDLSLDADWGVASRATVTVFHKQIDGFVASVTGPEVHGGTVYQVNRFQNARSAGLRGLELGVKTKLGQHLGWLRGLGLEANYTWVDGSTLDLPAQQRTPLQNVSRHSANWVGSYAAGAWSVRLAYNWRGRYVSSVVNVAGLGSVPVYVRPQGWLDAAWTYRWNERMSFQVSGSNLLRTRRSAYLGVPSRPFTVWMNDLELAAALVVRL